jgi:hypothetical protein
MSQWLEGRFVAAWTAAMAVTAIGLGATRAAADGWDGILTVEHDINARCAGDSLAPDQARGRVQWSATNYPEEIAQFYAYITTGTKSYADTLGSRAAAVQFAVADWLDMPNGSPRPRPKYIMWGIGDATATSVWPAPVDPAASAAKPEAAHVRALCTSSCYRPETRVAFANGYVPIAEALAQRASPIVTLAADATLEAPTFRVGRVDRYTMDATAAKQTLVALTTASGGHLEVTTNHPLVTGDGTMREAGTLAAGDALVRTDGTKDAITSAVQTPYEGRVYNVTPVGASALDQVVVAEGFLSGSAWYQNDGAGLLGRDLFRLSLPDELAE